MLSINYTSNKKDFNQLINEIKQTKKLDNNPYFIDLISQSKIYPKSKILSVVKRNTEEIIPSKLRISTMTAICSINLNIDLTELYKTITISQDIDRYPHIKSCQFGNKDIKGGVLKKPRKKRNPNINNKRNYFQNQVTFIILLNNIRKVNLKIFRNGKIQMTGLKSKEEGSIASKTILDKITELNSINSNIIADNGCSVDLKNTITDFSIVLINSDFFGGFKIKRETLYEILHSNGFFVSYEPDIYPGVNAKFYWNKKTIGTNNAGICSCENQCDGKGDGEGEGKCKKITIATFQSGNIIITGARSNEQTKDAYLFINSLLKTNYHLLIRYNINKNNNDIIKKNIE